VGPYRYPGPGASPQATPTWLHSSLQHINPQKHPQTPFRPPQQLVFCVLCVLYTHHTLQAGPRGCKGVWGHPYTGWGDGEVHNVSFCLFFIKFTSHHRVCGVSVVTSLSPTDLPGTRPLLQTYPPHPPHTYYSISLLHMPYGTALRPCSGPH
jgi:hypothetical protein